MNDRILSKESQNRIFFPGNPWPEGHQISDLDWEAYYDPDSGFWFNLTLTSVDYYADDPEWIDETQEESNDSGWWTAKGAWTNYHQCFIDAWGYDKSGFLAFEKNQKFDLDYLENKHYSVDPLPQNEWEENSFHIYLLGHDSVADHKIQFGKRQNDDGFTLNWSGKIALTYSEADEDYKYDFQATYDHVRLKKIYLPAKNERESNKVLHRKFKEPEKFEITVVEPVYGHDWQFAAIIRPK